MAKNWVELRKGLDITPEEEAVIEVEKELIGTLVKIREEGGLTQAEFARRCYVKQLVITRLGNGVHSPQVNSLLKILVPLGCTLRMTPMEKRRVGFYVGGWSCFLI